MRSFSMSKDAIKSLEQYKTGLIKLNKELGNNSNVRAYNKSTEATRAIFDKLQSSAQGVTSSMSEYLTS